MQRYNYHEYRKYQKRESYHNKVISEQKAEIKKLKLDTQKLETVESEKRKANKSMTYFKKQNSGNQSESKTSNFTTTERFVG